MAENQSRECVDVSQNDSSEEYSLHASDAQESRPKLPNSHSMLPPLSTDFNGCARMNCMPPPQPHRDSYHDATYQGRLSEGGGFRRPSDQIYPANSYDGKQQRQYSSQEMEGAAILNAMSGSTPVQFRRKPPSLITNNDADSSSGPPPLLMEPKPTASTPSAPSASPQTPGSNGGWGYPTGFPSIPSSCGNYPRPTYHPDYPRVPPPTSSLYPEFSSYNSQLYNSYSFNNPFNGHFNHNPNYHPLPTGVSLARPDYSDVPHLPEEGFRVNLANNRPQYYHPHQPIHYPYQLAPMHSHHQAHDRSSADVESDGYNDHPRPKKKQDDKHFEPYTCYFDPCPHETQIPPRKTISQYFGRNKICTTRMPKGIMPWTCRKHYQTGSYRAANLKTNGMRQADMVRAALQNCEKFEGLRDWTIVFGKSLQDAITIPATIGSKTPSPHSQRATAKSKSPQANGNKGVGRKRRSSSTVNKNKAYDPDLVAWAESVKPLLGEHKTTKDCFHMLIQMEEFSEKHPGHVNNLPLVEFQSQGDWPEPFEPLFKTQGERARYNKAKKLEAEQKAQNQAKRKRSSSSNESDSEEQEAHRQESRSKRQKRVIEQSEGYDHDASTVVGSDSGDDQEAAAAAGRRSQS